MSELVSTRIRTTAAKLGLLHLAETVNAAGPGTWW